MAIVKGSQDADASNPPATTAPPANDNAQSATTPAKYGSGKKKSEKVKVGCVNFWKGCYYYATAGYHPPLTSQEKALVIPELCLLIMSSLSMWYGSQTPLPSWPSNLPFPGILTGFQAILFFYLRKNILIFLMSLSAFLVLTPLFLSGMFYAISHGYMEANCISCIPTRCCCMVNDVGDFWRLSCEEMRDSLVPAVATVWLAFGFALACVFVYWRMQKSKKRNTITRSFSTDVGDERRLAMEQQQDAA